MKNTDIGSLVRLLNLHGEDFYQDDNGAVRVIAKAETVAGALVDAATTVLTPMNSWSSNVQLSIPYRDAAGNPVQGSVDIVTIYHQYDTQGFYVGSTVFDPSVPDLV